MVEQSHKFCLDFYFLLKFIVKRSWDLWLQIILLTPDSLTFTSYFYLGFHHQALVVLNGCQCPNHYSSSPGLTAVEDQLVLALQIFWRVLLVPKEAFFQVFMSIGRISQILCLKVTCYKQPSSHLQNNVFPVIRHDYRKDIREQRSHETTRKSFSLVRSEKNEKGPFEPQTHHTCE